MDNSEILDSLLLINPDLNDLRRKLTEALGQVLIDWNEVVSLKQTNNTEDRTKVILSFMIKIFETVFDVMDISKDERNYTFWKWKEEKQLRGMALLTRLVYENGKLDEKEDRQFLSESIEYQALVSENMMLDDWSLALRAWIPALDQNSEIILVFQVNVPRSRFVTSEIVAIIQTYFETLLMGIRTTDYLSLKNSFYTLARNRISSSDFITVCERLIYLDIWRAAFKKKSREGRKIIDLDSWVNQQSSQITLDTCEHDYLIASYLISLIFTMSHDPTNSRVKLEYSFKNQNPKKLRFRISRGLSIVLGPNMNLCRWIMAQAIIMLEKPMMEEKNKIYAKYGVEYNLCAGWNFKNERDSLRLNLLLAISEFEVDRIISAKEISEPDFEDLVDRTSELNIAIKMQLKTVLKNCSECVEVSSKWLDGWLCYQLLGSSILPTSEGQENFDPRKKAELLKHWLCFLRYVCDVLIIPQLQKNNHLDLPSNFLGDEIENSKLTLLCEWAHGLGVPRTIPLYTWLSKTQMTELALYSLSGKGSHRQHIFHAQDTCLLGCVILLGKYLDETDQKTTSLIELLAGVDNQKQEELICNWLVASLLHDIGYELQVIPKGLSILLPSISSAFKKLLDNIKQGLEQSSMNFVDFDPTQNRAIEGMKASDHAFISAAAIISHLALLNDNEQTVSRFFPAINAIAEHGSKDTSIDYSQDLLATFLLVIDQLQDWGRIRLDATQLTNSFLHTIRQSSDMGEPDPIVVKKLFSTSLLFLKINGIDEGCNLILPSDNGKVSIHFLLHGPYAGESGYEPAAAWLDICRAFQRIRSMNSQILPNIKAVLQHGYHANIVSEFIRLERFANANVEQRGVILDWMALVRKKGIIDYGKNDKPYEGFEYSLPAHMNFERYEWITYAIPDLNNNDDRPLKGMPDDFYSQYRKYRKDNP